MKKTASCNKELLDRVEGQVLTRERTRAILQTLFANAEGSRARDRSKIEKLFEQGSVAETSTPSLLPKEASMSLSDNDPKSAIRKSHKKSKTASVSSNVDAFFKEASWLTDAQRRFPELLKVAGGTASGPAPKPAPSTTKQIGTTGPVPTRSHLSGGAS